MFELSILRSSWCPWRVEMGSPYLEEWLCFVILTLYSHVYLQVIYLCCKSHCRDLWIFRSNLQYRDCTPLFMEERVCVSCTKPRVFPKHKYLASESSRSYFWKCFTESPKVTCALFHCFEWIYEVCLSQPDMLGEGTEGFSVHQPTKNKRKA